ncbi:MAG: D-2-hydroxyacid dehydrogenase [Lachnospiraceae bacterium]|nr:D-2-hydroxyacid dehydrogenase [Lachnospiraceae bacterium]
MKKIAVTFTPISAEILEKIRWVAPGYQVIEMPMDDARLAECEIVFGQAHPKILAESKKLEWYHTQSAGVDYVLKSEYRFPEEAILTNSSGSYGVTISEYLLTITLMLLRKMNEYVLVQRECKWQRLGAEKSVYGSTITIVGLGDIGENYARRCKALGATVNGVVRRARANKPDCVDALYTVDALEKAIAAADVVALCLPGTEDTYHLFDKARLKQMKKGAILLNIGRGTAIDTKALIGVLQSGHLGGVGLDVTDPEPLPEDSPLWKMPNVMITPHVSGNNTLPLTNEMGVDKFVKYLEDYVAGRAFERIVDQKAGY